MTLLEVGLELGEETEEVGGDEVRMNMPRLRGMWKKMQHFGVHTSLLLWVHLFSVAQNELIQEFLS